MKLLILILLFLSNILIYCDNDDDNLEDNEDLNEYGFYDRFDYDEYFGSKDNINIVSISYELQYNNISVLKVIIKTYEEITNDINFIAYLKSEEEEKQYLLNCSNTFYDTIECLSERKISLNIEDKYFFYYEKGKNNNLTFDGSNILEDENRISLVFKPEISENLKLYKDNRKIIAITNKEIIDGGYLYIVRKSKKILHKPKDGFNKYIELNNFIFHAGLSGDFPPSTLIAYQEAIRRGYHIVDAYIQFSKDKVPVIYHMKNLDNNTNGKGEISSKTLEELKKIDFGINFNKKFKGEIILTFESLLKLCKENDIIIDLNLTLLNYKKYFNETDEFLKIMINLIKKYDMFDSIFFSDNRKETILKIKSFKNDISFSLNSITDKQSKEKLKDEFKGSRIIYNLGNISLEKEINKEALEEKIKVSEIDDLKLAKKIQSLGVNYISTNKLDPFLIQNEKENPIIVRCSPSVEDVFNSECEIDENIRLIDNEIYNIYYSDNIYNISEDINELPIGEFKYVDTNILDELYYSVVYFNFDEGIIQLNTSKKIKKNEIIEGIVGPAYDNVAELYQYNFLCEGNNMYSINCKIKKDDENKVKFKGNYSIYSLEGYSLNSNEVLKRMDSKKIYQRFYFYIIIGVFLVFIIIIIICCIKKNRNDSFNEMKISGNAYISDNNLYK